METVTRSHSQAPRGVTEHVCVTSAKPSGEFVLWDQEEVHSSDKKDSL